jgi:hypothetical protein
LIVCRIVKYKGGSRVTEDVIIQFNVVKKGERRFPFFLFENLEMITNNHRPPGSKKTTT